MEHVINGFSAYTNWEVWAAGVFFLVPFLGGVALAMAFVEQRPGTSMLLMSLIVPALAGLGTILYTVTVAPIALGMSGDASWNSLAVLAGQDAGFLLKLFVVSMAISIGVSLIPVVGNIPGVHTFAASSYVLAVVVWNAVAGNPALASKVSYWPGFALMFFYLIFAVALSLVVTNAIVKFVEVAILGGKTVEQSVAGGYVAIAIPTLLAHAGAFMYGSWLGSQLGL